MKDKEMTAKLRRSENEEDSWRVGGVSTYGRLLT